MNDRYWNQNTRGRFNRGGFRGFNRGGRGGHVGRGAIRGWSRNPDGYNGPNFGGNRYQNEYRFQPNRRQNNQRKQEKKQGPGKRLSEDLIGVTEYISDHQGFNGIIKSRYSDFQVAEMNENGEIAKLTTKTPPLPPTDVTVDDDEDLILNKYNLEILPMEMWDKINSLTMMDTTGKEADDQKVEIDMEGVSKEQRTKIHDAVKKAFGESIVGSTVNVGDKKFMRFVKYRKGVRIDNRVKWVWPGEYVYFIVHKQNCDTMEAAARIAEKLRVSPKPTTIGYAGTKDRRAKTSQWFSIKRVDPARIASSCKQLRDVDVGNYSFARAPLKLGMLKGNKFRIALRNITADEASVDEACQLLKDRGFINYYGLQRFGSRVDVPTFDIGLKLLQGKFKEAIDSILEPTAEGPLGGALHVYRARGAAQAAALVPARCSSSEARLLRALAAAPADLVGALARLARNIRLLYLHSYQSLVWNRAVSERIRRFGLRPVVGDCVPLPNAQITDQEQTELDSEDEEDDDDNPTSTSETTSATDTSPVKETPPTTVTDEQTTDVASTTQTPQPSEATENKPTKKNKASQKKPPLPVKFLTQEDVDSGNYTLFNIVMPLPGAFVVYPPNMIDYYEELLTKDGLKMNLKHKLKSYNLAGAYRHMVVRPAALTWRHARYSDPFGDLLASDSDDLENRPVTAILPDGKYKALLLDMLLPSSCYATMALRELLKVDTSSDNQALQNNYHKKNTEEKKEAPGKSEGTSQAEGKVTEEVDAADKETVDGNGCVGEEVEDDKNEEDSDNIGGEKRKLEEKSDNNYKKLKTDT